MTDSTGAPFPWIRLIRKCRFRADMDKALVRTWQSELRTLCRTLRKLQL